MKSKKIIASLMALSIIGSSSFIFGGTAKAASKNTTIPMKTASLSTVISPETETLTADTQYVPYTHPEKVYGYAKDANGKPLAYRDIMVMHGDSRPSERLMEHGVYEAVKTDANGYYSFWAYDSGYYFMYLTYGTISRNEVQQIYNGEKEWPSEWIIQNGAYYLSDVEEPAYVITH